MTDSIVTECAAGHPGVVFWRHYRDALPAFDPVVFDEAQLLQKQLITGQAGAGRGNTFFFRLQGQALVLRHYRRGGLVQRLSKRHYLYTGLQRTRAMREFDMLAELCRQQLPVSRPYACRVVRQGPFYQASLVTHWLPGRTLAESLSAGTAQAPLMATWLKLGELIARLHAAGVYHADLNAHNIMLDGDESVSLIDFDRARIRPVPAGDPASDWCRANIERLQRSLLKITTDQAGFAEGFAALEQQWQESLRYSISPRS